MPGRLMSVFCRSGAHEWRRVLRHGVDGLDVEKQTMTFREAWEARPQGGQCQSNDGLVRLRWPDLLVPLPEVRSPAWAWALTYQVHQKEARLTDVFFFEKRAVPESACAPIQHLPTLDYEAEVALLLHRGEPDRFGFLFANDLTDRTIQVRSFDRRNPGPGFAAAKSFPGALRVGPLLVIADASLWLQLEVRLAVNGQWRQEVKARECLRTPRQFHQQAFADTHPGDWALALTGTTGGTIFQSPTGAQRVQYLARTGFSARRAREAWLRRFQFLRVGDQLEMHSEILGRSHAAIVASLA